MSDLVIGGRRITVPVLTAPMAGITNRAYREILHEMGAGLCYTEMVSDKGLCYGDRKTDSLLDLGGEVGAVGIQLCGSEPASMAQAARIIERKAERFGNVVVLDINMGCPVNKIVKNGEGSRLMLEVERAAELMRQVVAAVELPVTAKMRLGWDDESKNVLELAERLQEVGCQAVTIHGRTRQQFYSGTADWTLIGEAKRRLDIPVIGNGDIYAPSTAARRLLETGCDGVMIGRGMIGNPWLVRDTVRLVSGLPPLPPPDIFEIIELACRHLDRSVELVGEYIGVREMRSHLPWYIKGRRGAATMRNSINQLNDPAAIKELLRSFAVQTAASSDC